MAFLLAAARLGRQWCGTFRQLSRWWRGSCRWLSRSTDSGAVEQVAAWQEQTVPQAVAQLFPAHGTVEQAVVRQPQVVEQVVEQVALRQPQAVQQAVAQTVPQAVPAGGVTVGQAVVLQPQAFEQVVVQHLQVVEQAITNAVPAGSGVVGQAVARQPQVVEWVAPRQLQAVEQAVEQAVPQTVVWLSRWQHGRSRRFRWWFPQFVPAGGCAVRRRSLSNAVCWVRVMAASFYHVWLRQLQDEGPNAGLTDTEG
ncbi:unnamed protein product [Oreochromis niloticus]|nr:unnamed protein product [Mustela putorius furo]